MVYVRLLELMAEKGYPSSLRELAKNIGENRERIRSFASNETPNLSVVVMNKICNYYNCSLSELIIHIKDDQEV